jgi:hypothetical protein
MYYHACYKLGQWSSWSFRITFRSGWLIFRSVGCWDWESGAFPRSSDSVAAAACCLLLLSVTEAEVLWGRFLGTTIWLKNINQIILNFFIPNCWDCTFSKPPTPVLSLIVMDDDDDVPQKSKPQEVSGPVMVSLFLPVCFCRNYCNLHRDQCIWCGKTH